VSADGVEKEFEWGAIVNRTGCHDGPDAFAPGAAAFAAGALRDETVDDDKSYCSFGGVVGGFGAGSGDELKVRFAVVDETVAHVLGGPGAGHALCASGDDAAALFTQGSVEPGFAHRLAPVDDAEHLANLGEQEFSIGGGGFVRQCGEELDVADQVGDAELDEDVKVFHVFAVSPEVVAARGCESLSCICGKPRSSRSPARR